MQRPPAPPPKPYKRQEEKTRPVGNIQLPEVITEKLEEDLEELLHNDDTLTAIYHAIDPRAQEATEQSKLLLDKSELMARELLDTKTRIDDKRRLLNTRLAKVKELELLWTNQEAELDRVQRPFTAENIRMQLQSAVHSSEQVSDSFLRSFLDKSSVSGSEISEFVKQYRESRKLYHLRRENLERVHQGKVTGI